MTSNQKRSHRPITMQDQMGEARTSEDRATRYEVPARILVDAESPIEAENKALALGATLDREEGPGAFFYGITVAVTGDPTEAAEDYAEEGLGEHAESLQSAR